MAERSGGVLGLVCPGVHDLAVRAKRQRHHPGQLSGGVVGQAEQRAVALLVGRVPGGDERGLLERCLLGVFVGELTPGVDEVGIGETLSGSGADVEPDFHGRAR